MLLTRISEESALNVECAVSGPLGKQANIFVKDPLVQELLNSVPNIYVILNRERQIVFANQALSDLLAPARRSLKLGMFTGEALGCKNAIGQRNDACTSNEYCRTCGVLRALTSSEYGQESIQECRIVQESGEALDLRIWATPIHVHGDEFTLLAINDISHEKRRFALERVFFHDILNTASSVQGFAQLLLDISSGDNEDMASIISDMARNLVEEIRAQQVLSSAESGNLNFNMATVDTRIAIHEVIEHYRHHESAIDKTLRIDEECLEVEFDSDPALLRRVLGNMILNALEACSPGQAVTIGCQEGGDDEIAFTVHNPHYMPREVQLQVFQRSFSTKGAGRGLGTYSMKLLSERYLQGRVGFETSQERGTTFTARYPRQLMPSWMVSESMLSSLA